MAGRAGCRGSAGWRGEAQAGGWLVARLCCGRARRGLPACRWPCPCLTAHHRLLPVGCCSRSGICHTRCPPAHARSSERQGLSMLYNFYNHRKWSNYLLEDDAMQARPAQPRPRPRPRLPLLPSQEQHCCTALASWRLCCLGCHGSRGVGVVRHAPMCLPACTLRTKCAGSHTACPPPSRLATWHGMAAGGLLQPGQAYLGWGRTPPPPPPPSSLPLSLTLCPGLTLLVAAVAPDALRAGAGARRKPTP